MDIPIKNLLKKRSQQELASLQDEVVDILYSVASNAVFHGGTCIWRCYGGKRFSEDLDFYVAPKDNFSEMLKLETEKRGLQITKYRQTDNSIYSKISNNIVECSLEIALRKKEGAFVLYEKADGSSMSILALSKEELVIEKAFAFASRRLVRDIYDVFFLLGNANLKKVSTPLKKIVANFKEPVDEKNLKTLVYSGNAPPFEQMMQRIEGAIK